MQSLLYATRKHSVWVFFCCTYISFTSSFLVLGIGKIHTIFENIIKEKLEDTILPTEEGGHHYEKTNERKNYGVHRIL